MLVVVSVQVKGEVHILEQNVTDWVLMLLAGTAEGFQIVFPILGGLNGESLGS